MGLKEGLPLPIRRWAAPVASALVHALERGLAALRTRHLKESVDPVTLRGGWLGEYAALHAYTRREGETDHALMTRIRDTGVGGRMVTTDDAIVRAILEATGITVRLRPSRERVNVLDDLAAMAGGDRGLDFGYVYEDGEEVFENVPPAVRGYRGRVPAHGAWGPGGLLVEVARPYDPVLERRIIQTLTDKLPAQAGFELSWARRLAVEWTDTMRLSDSGRACWEGFGADPFGVSPFGGECEEFDVGGFGVDPFGENFGSRRPVPVTRATVTG